MAQRPMMNPATSTGVEWREACRGFPGIVRLSKAPSLYPWHSGPSRNDNFIRSQIPHRNERALNSIISWNASLLINLNPLSPPCECMQAHTCTRARTRTHTHTPLSFHGKPASCVAYYLVQRRSLWFKLEASDKLHLKLKRGEVARCIINLGR